MTPEELAPGTAFHGLEIVEVLGRGGMGVVYKARQPELDRFVALKILPERLASDPEFVQRFRREAKALASLSHPNIVSIFDFGTEAGRCFFVMEHVDGANLRRVMRDGLQLPDQPLSIVRQVCDGLEYAHAEGVIHRDIKPENILVDRKGRVKIADFGLAKMAMGPADAGFVTQSNMVMGTPPYMAPEQYDTPKGVDQRADIYAVGVLFYEMLTGAQPSDPFTPPSRCMPVDERLDGVVAKALQRKRDERYQRASELKTDLETAVTAPVRARPSPARWRVALAALGVLIIAGIPISFVLNRRRRVEPTPSPQRPVPDRFARVASDRFRWENRGATAGDEMVFQPGARAEAPLPLPRRFALKFRLRYEIEPGQEPWIILEFGDSQALWLFPEADHVAAFMTNDGGWGIRAKQPMPKGRPAPGAWSEAEVRWDGSNLRLLVDGEPGFVHAVGEPLGSRLTFVLQGAAREVRVRDVRIRDDDQP